MKTFFRVQNKIKKDDFTDFDNIDDARKFCDDWAFNEDTHELQKWEPKRAPSKGNVVISIFNDKDGKPRGALIHSENDPSHVNMIAAMANPHAAGKVQYDRK